MYPVWVLPLGPRIKPAATSGIQIPNRGGAALGAETMSGPGRRRGTLLALAAAAAAATSGCGSSTDGATAPGHLGTDSSASGAQVFRNSCSACHSLAGVGAAQPSGGALDAFHLTPAQAASFTRVMPTAGTLSAREIQAVADYVAASERRTHGGR